ncbi:unnamed protein product [Gemmataceae bacterium]|nr:unnamed protein product [Gemmataceae bacterium]VTT99025.1 unnamed protein product [Gemmataceae bacterium]
MTLTDLEIHYDRLADVRAEILDQGDEPPAELLDRLGRVRSLIAAVRQRRRAERPAAEEPASVDPGDLRA